MYEALNLSGKVAIITGSASGIGRETARIMAGRGAKVVIADINMEGAQVTASAIGDAAMAVALDLGDDESIAAAVAAVVDRFGRIDILHNNATASGRELVEQDGMLEDMPNWLWERLFHVNCRGAMVLTRTCLPYLIEAKGSIVNTVSGHALQGAIRNMAYSATKAALIQMTRSIATAYGRQGVRCNAVAPGLILTETVKRDFPPELLKLVLDETPRDRVGAPEDVAEAVAFLASDAARNITGQCLAVDGGVSMHMPGLQAWMDVFEPKEA
jgi:NAD(P)-dependent dehydrogenase (short-subunit alcohol dehydrogenase family)